MDLRADRFATSPRGGGVGMADSYPAVLAFAGVTEAAMSLGHRTYSGTVAATERRP